VFTEFEISLLRNRLACNALPTFPFDAQWWNAFPDDKSKLYANLPAKELAQEAWDLMMSPLDKVAHLYFRAPFVEDYMTSLCLVMSTPYAPDSVARVDLRKVKAEMEGMASKDESGVPNAFYDKLLKPALLPDEGEELEDEEDLDDYGEICTEDEGGVEAYGFEADSEDEDESEDEMEDEAVDEDMPDVEE